MIGFLQGVVESVSEKELLLNVGGVGYEVVISPDTANFLPPIGEEVKIYTFLSVREDGISLFGFQTADDLNIFKLLITVSGIGPKGAQAILSALKPDDLRFAILSGDAKAIARAPGIGKKTAERLILELKDKLSIDTPSEGGGTAAFSGGVKGTDTPSKREAREEAAEALQALGFSSTDAYRAVKAAETDDIEDANALLQEALKYL